VLGLLLALTLAAPAAAQGLLPVPPVEARVLDQTGTLTAGEQADLEQRLKAFEQRKGSQIAVLMLPSTAPETIEQYSIRVAEAWKIGRGKTDDGVLLLVAKDDRTMRIEVGYGLEGALTDATSRRIIGEIITPLFRQGDYFGGLGAGLQKIMDVIDGEPLPPPDHKWDHPRDRFRNVFPVLFFGVFIAAGVLRAVLGRMGGAVALAGLVGVVTFFLSQVLLFALLAGVGAFLLGLITGSGGGGGFGPGGFGGYGGGGFGGGGFGGGGGGFSGGGGGFGGGGASGRW
jgi:uncharacterized protein